METRHRKTIHDILTLSPVVPVVVVERMDDVVPLAKAVSDGGLKVIELTMRSPIACEALHEMKQEFPHLKIGMGTVLSEGQVESAAKAGADFLVTPGTFPRLLDSLIDSGVPVLPGVATASEAMTLFEAGFDTLKFFPAEQSGGASWLKAIAGPMPHLRFCPTGGISVANAPDYLALDTVLTVGGSWLCAPKLVEAGRWDEITKLSREAAAFARKAVPERATATT